MAIYTSKQSLHAFRRAAAPRKVLARRTPTIQVQALFGGGGEGGGGMGNLMENMKKAQALVQNEAGKVQAELAATEFDGYDEDETVKVVFLGNQQPKSIELSDDAMELSKEQLEKNVQEAMSDAHARSVAGMRDKMSELAKKLGLPPNMQMPGQ